MKQGQCLETQSSWRGQRRTPGWARWDRVPTSWGAAPGAPPASARRPRSCPRPRPHLAGPHEKDLGLQHPGPPTAGPPEPTPAMSETALVSARSGSRRADWLSSFPWRRGAARGGRREWAGSGRRGLGARKLPVGRGVQLGVGFWLKVAVRGPGRGKEGNKNPDSDSLLSGENAELTSLASVFVGRVRFADARSGISRYHSDRSNRAELGRSQPSDAFITLACNWLR